MRRGLYGKPIRDPLGRVPDGEDRVAADAAAHPVCGLVDRVSRGEDQDDHPQRYADDRVAGAESPQTGPVEAIHQVVVAVRGVGGHQKRK